MALRIRFQHTTSQTLKYSVERIADGYLLDHADNTFKTTPTTLKGSLVEDTGVGRYGLYKATIASTPTGQYSNGNYVICVHDDNITNDPVIGVMTAQMISGDDNNIVSGSGVVSGGSGSVDTASIAAAVWDYLTSSSTATGTFGSLLKTNLDATVSSRSTFAGGAVSSVTNPVTVGTNNDKSGYNLSATGLNLTPISGGIPVTGPVNISPTGLDAIIVETGVNMRQATSLMLAALAGQIVSNTGTYIIKAPVTEAIRIQATADASGNRYDISINLPT